MYCEKEIEQIKNRLARHEETMKELAKAIKWCAIAIAINVILHFL